MHWDVDAGPSLMMGTFVQALQPHHWLLQLVGCHVGVGSLSPQAVLLGGLQVKLSLSWQRPSETLRDWVSGLIGYSRLLEHCFKQGLLTHGV